MSAFPNPHPSGCRCTICHPALGQTKTLGEIARLLGMSRACVALIERRAIAKMRKRVGREWRT